MPLSVLAWWSLATMVTSVAGLLLSRWNPKNGWRYGLGCQVVWIVRGAVTGQPGDIILSVIFIVTYVINLATSRRALWVRARRGQTLAEALQVAWEAELTRTGQPVPAAAAELEAV